MPRPGALKHTGQAIVGDAVKRVSYSRTGRHVAKIQQGHEVYPQWLRHRVSPPKRESMPVFMRGSTSAYLLLLVMEDLHWVDPSTLEWLSLLVDQGPTARIPSLCTCR